jgi:hypothetical protein
MFKAFKAQHKYVISIYGPQQSIIYITKMNIQ